MCLALNEGTDIEVRVNTDDSNALSRIVGEKGCKIGIALVVAAAYCYNQGFRV